MKVLICEDQELIAKVACRVLTVYGCTVVITKTVAEAVEKVQEDIYDIVLMDVWLPDQSGVVGAKCIKELSQNPVRVFLWTSDIEECLLQHPNCRDFTEGFLQKPLKHTSLEFQRMLNI